MQPTVSINLCCYNSEKFLRETLDSIINQTYKDWELVIINDGSADSTESIIYEYIEKGCPIVYHYQSNHGLGYSRNEAVRCSSGEYIAFIDHDDIWMPNKLEKQTALFSDNPEIDFAYTNYYIMKNNQKLLAFKKKQPSGYVFEKFLYHCPVALVTAMLKRKSLIRSNIQFDENLHLSEEYDVFMHLLYKSQAGYIEEPLAIYRIHPEMSSIVKIFNYYTEGIYILKKFKEIDGCQTHYNKALKKYELNLEYLKAKILINQGDSVSGRKQINEHKFLYFKYFMLYIFSFMPSGIRHYIQNIFSKSSIL